MQPTAKMIGMLFEWADSYSLGEEPSAYEFLEAIIAELESETHHSSTHAAKSLPAGDHPDGW